MTLTPIPEHGATSRSSADLHDVVYRRLSAESTHEGRVEYLDNLRATAAELNDLPADARNTALVQLARFYLPADGLWLARKYFAEDFPTQIGRLLRWSGAGATEVKVGPSAGLFLGADRPEAFLAAVPRLEAATSGWASLPGWMASSAARSPQPSLRIDQMLRLELLLGDRGLSLETLDRSRVTPSEMWPDKAVNTEWWTRAELWRVEFSLQATEAYSGYVAGYAPWLPIATSGLSSLLAVGLTELGFAPGRAKAIATSWLSYDAASPEWRRDEDREVLAHPDGRAALVDHQLGKVLLAYDTFRRYADEHGRDELRTVVSLFDVHQMSRLGVGHWHEQLHAWRKDPRPISMVVIAAHSDHNGAFGTSYVSELGRTMRIFADSDLVREGGLVVVAEVGTPDHDNPLTVDEQIGRIRDLLVAREAERGRTPDVDLVVYASHMAPDGMYFGGTERAVRVDDFLAAHPNGAFGPPLGSHMQIALDGCEPAGQLDWSYAQESLQRFGAAPAMQLLQANIATVLSWSGSTVQAAPAVTAGVERVDGQSVVYLDRAGEPMPATVIPGRVVGRSVGGAVGTVTPRRVGAFDGPQRSPATRRGPG